MSNPFDLGNLENLLGSLTSTMNAMKEDASGLEMEGQAGGNAVVARVNGNLQVLQVRISPAVMDDREMLEDLVVVAVNDALRRVQDEMSRKMQSLTDGLPLPPGLL